MVPKGEATLSSGLAVKGGVEWMSSACGVKKTVMLLFFCFKDGKGLEGEREK